MNLFSIDGKLYQSMQLFWNLLKLNFIWLLFSLPIITIGASTVAAYTVLFKMLEKKDEMIIGDFIKSFRLNWKQGIPLGLIHIFVLYSFYINLEILTKVDELPASFIIIALVIGIFGIFFLTYTYPLCARYENSLLGILRNSLTVTMKYFFTTILLWVAIGLLIFVFLSNSTLMLLGILIGPATLFLLVSVFTMRIFKAIEKKNEQISA